MVYVSAYRTPSLYNSKIWIFLSFDQLVIDLRMSWRRKEVCVGMNILFPVRPQDPRIENILVNSPMLKENKYFVKSLPTDIKSFENLYVFLADGSLKKIKN